MPDRVRHDKFEFMVRVQFCTGTVGSGDDNPHFDLKWQS